VVGAEGQPPAIDVRPDRAGSEQKAHGGFLTTRQAAAVAGRFVGTIRAALAEGRLRGFQLPGGRWRIDRADLNDYVSPKRPTDDRCGSLTGISRHRRDHTPLCDRCRATKHEHEREWRRRRHSTR
jgi:excisionase family DNA binding protein